MKGVPCGLNQRSTEVEWKENEHITPHDVQVIVILTYGKI